MRGKTKHRTVATSLLAIVALIGTLLGSVPTITHASRNALDMNVTLSVYTCCGSLEGFDNPDPTNIFSIYHLYHGLLSKYFPHLKWKETVINDYATMETKLALAVNSGNPPDMAFVQGGYVGFTVLRKLAQPLDAYFKQYDITDSYFLPGMARWTHFGGHWWAMPAVSGPLGGQLIYLPQYMTPLGFNNSNLRSFNDLYKMSQKAVRFDKAGNLTRIGYWPNDPGLYDSWGGGGIPAASALMCPPGHGLYNAHNEPTATDPCNVAWMTYQKKLADLYGGYVKLSKFLAGDPQIFNGSPKDYMVTGKALIPADAFGYFNLVAFNIFKFGTKNGVTYNLTPAPPTASGTLKEVVNYPGTQQTVVIPVGAKHPAQAFAISKFITWDNGYLMGPSGNGSPVAKDQERWVQSLIQGAGALRKSNGLPGNPMASLVGIKQQPMLARMSTATFPLNPVNIFYQQQLAQATANVLYGKQSPAAALAQVQRLVVAQEQRLKSQYGPWNW